MNRGILVTLRRLSREHPLGAQISQNPNRYGDGEPDKAQLPEGRAAEETAAFFKSESERWGNVIRKVGITAE